MSGVGVGRNFSGGGDGATQGEEFPRLIRCETVQSFMYFAELLAQCFRVIEDGVADFRRVALTAIADARNELDIYLIRLVSHICLLYTSPSPRDKRQSRMPSSA